MFCYCEGLLAAFSVLLMAALALSRSATLSCLLTGGAYLALRLFSLEPVPLERARLVVQPRGNPARVAHRGGGHDAPENTLAAIRQAAENGATGVEIDLEFTADGIPVLMHDSTVDRTTDGSGNLRDLTFAEIRRYNPCAKHRLWRDYRGEKIPTLKEAVLESMHYDLIIYFDVKGHADQAVAALKDLYLEYPRLYNTSVVCSFMPDVVYKMRQADRNVITALTHRPWSLSHFGDGKPRFESFWKHYFMMAMDVILDWSMHNFLWHLCGVSVFLVQKNYVSQEYVRQWSSKGVQVVAWTVNTFAEKMYYDNVLQCSYMTDSLLEDCDPHY
ncbi:glycerophosphodiester phosphodiesterase 1 isoform X2 [Anolis sagrei]|uniref:glycerophosphodiester phosphodiesterase 1 isoform X2 n=2 Tax=Anolis sagrei TaxID=38937 RepID=UPI00295B35E6|nr:glycerophosphodiester phosphodiesterase 1 isoform X1 [Anolis sagrei ordinatus]